MAKIGTAFRAKNNSNQDRVSRTEQRRQEHKKPN